MRASMLASFGVVLTLGASSADANIICDTKQAIGSTNSNTDGSLQDIKIHASNVSALLLSMPVRLAASSQIDLGKSC